MLCSIRAAGTSISAAVTAGNIVLIPLDISAITDHMIFNGLGENYPLLFSASDVMIYNTQGFLMQLLSAPNSVTPSPTWSTTPDTS